MDIADKSEDLCESCNTSKHSKKLDDLTGMTFGDWTVLKYVGNRHWLCRCSCGKEQSVHGYKLRSGSSTSCGHNKNSFIDLTGMTFGEWKVIEYVGNGQWKCLCSCGNEGVVTSKALRDGKSKSCGHNTTGFKDLKGLKFGKWEALRYLGNTIWECRCSCGSLGKVKAYDLLNGRSTSCGCETTGFQDLTGKTFGDWHVDKYLGHGRWECTCCCGTKASVKGEKLRNGTSRSCGCGVLRHIKETNRSLYGVDYNGQHHRTSNEVSMTSTRDNLLKVMHENFDELPTPKQLGKLVNLTEHRVMVLVRKFGLDDFVNLNKATSQYEDEICSLFPGAIRSDRKILGGKEIDIYYPNSKLAIEFNGTYWHSDLYKDRMYHQNKTIECAKRGIRLIHIFEYEWLDEDKKAKIIGLLSNILEPRNRVIYARKTSIKPLDEKIYRDFLEVNHLQGYAPAQVKLGAFENETGELLGVMSFGNPRFNSDYEYELIRFVWRQGLAVVGGVEKMFKYFLNEYKPSSIITYSDISKFTGNVYTRIGFKALCVTDPNYVWVNPLTGDVMTRYQTMKHKLVESGIGTVDESESDIMYGLGFYRVYDSGNIKLEWRNDT